MAESFLDISEDFRSFIEQWQNYCKDQGKIEYDPKSFQWFRPDDVEDTSDVRKLCKPYVMDNLNADARNFIEEARDTVGNSSDCALLTTQYDIITSASRAFAERHKSKLRHFAHAVATCNRMGQESGIIKKGLMTQLQEIMKRANS
jgi:hypothetical protein